MTRFFTIKHAFIHGDHVYAVVVSYAENIRPEGNGDVSWESFPDGRVSIFCTNGKEFYYKGARHVSVALKWFALTDRNVLDKPVHLSRNVLPSPKTMP
jgi:hypothetical protein